MLFTSCSNNSEKDIIKINISYEGLVDKDDFERYNNAYSSDYENGELEFSRDNYNMIKIICDVKNESANKLFELDFVSYKDENVFYESGAIDIEPSVPIEPNSTHSYEAYIYVNKNLNDDEISQVMKNTDFKFIVSSSKETYGSPVKKINLNVRNEKTYITVGDYLSY